MSKTAPIPDDIHAMIIDKQTELKRKHKITVKISDIIAIVVKNNIHKVGKYLGLTSEEKSNIADIEQDVVSKSNVVEDIKQDVVSKSIVSKSNVVDGIKQDIVSKSIVSKSNVVDGIKQDIVSKSNVGVINAEGIKTEGIKIEE